MIKVHKENKVFLSHIIAYESDKLIYFDRIEDSYVTINDRGQLKMFDQSWNQQKSQDLVIAESLEYLDQHVQQLERIIILNNHQNGIIIVRIQLTNINVTITQLCIQLDNLFILNSLSTQPTVLEGISLDKEHRVNYLIIYDEQIHLKKIAVFEQYQVDILVKLEHYLVGQTKDMKILILHLKSQLFYQIDILEKYGSLKESHQFMESILLLYEGFMAIFTIKDESVDLIQINHHDSSRLFIHEGKFVQYFQNSGKLNFLSLDLINKKLVLDLELQTDSSLQIQGSTKMIAGDFYYIFQDSGQLIVIFQFDQSPLLRKYIGHSKSIKSKSNQVMKIPDNNNSFYEMEENPLFQLIKRNKYLNIDQLICYTIKRGFYQCLLLLSSRVRNYDLFFKAWNSSKSPLLLINSAILKLCECFDYQYLKEEFMDAVMFNVSKEQTKMVEFLKFLANHSDNIASVENFVTILNQAKNIRDRKVEIISRVKKQIGSLKSMQAIAKIDNYNIKTKLYTEQQRGCLIRDTLICQACRLSIQIHQESNDLIYFSHCHHVYHIKCVLVKNQSFDNNKQLSCPKCESKTLPKLSLSIKK